MNIIDKTNENWQVGDKVQTEDCKTGLIQKDLDNNYVIVRVDNKHFGKFGSGLVYAINPYISKLQMNHPEFHKINEIDNTDENWKPGDFVKDDCGTIGVIMRDYDGNYVISNTELDLTNPISVTEHTLTDLKILNKYFHKVPSKVILGEE